MKKLAISTGVILFVPLGFILLRPSAPRATGPKPVYTPLAPDFGATNFTYVSYGFLNSDPFQTAWFGSPPVNGQEQSSLTSTT